MDERPRCIINERGAVPSVKIKRDLCHHITFGVTNFQKTEAIQLQNAKVDIGVHGMLVSVALSGCTEKNDYTDPEC